MHRSKAVTLALSLTFGLTTSLYGTNEQGKNSLMKPIPGKALRVLFIAPSYLQRDSLELSQHLSCKATLVTTGGGIHMSRPDTFGFPTIYQKSLTRSDLDVQNDIRTALNTEHDAIVIAPRPVWDVWPNDIREDIIRTTLEGTALVMVSPDASFRENVLSQADSATLKKPRFKPLDNDNFQPRFYRYGNGSITVLTPRISHKQHGYLVDAHCPTRATFEYRLSRIANVLYSVCSGDQRPINSIEAQANPAERTITVECDISQAHDLQVLIRDSDYTILRDTSQTAAKGETLDIPLDSLVSGRYYVEVRARDDNKHVVDWGETYVDVQPEISIRALALSDDTPSIGDMMKVTVSYAEAVPDKHRLKMLVEDVYGRIFYEKNHTGLPGTLNITIPDTSCSLYNYAVAQLFENDTLVDEKRIAFTIPDNVEEEDIYLLVWAMHIRGNWRERQMYRMMKDAGVDALTHMWRGKDRGWPVAEAGLRLVPQATHFKRLTLPDHLFNEDWIAGQTQASIATASQFGRFGPLAYTLGCENFVDGEKDPRGRFFDGESVWGPFRNYLKSVYGSIENVNSQWESRFESWEDIRFENEASMLARPDNPSPWVDFRMFVSHRYIGLLQKMRATIREKDPGAMVGMDGMEHISSYDGYDWWAISRNFDMQNTYAYYFASCGFPNKLFNGHAIRSFAPRTNLRGCWMNWVQLGREIPYVSWTMLFSGFNSIWWWEALCLGYEAEAFDWHYQPTPAFRQIMEQVAEMKQGAATLLAHSQPEKPKVAVHYSENNWHASTLSSRIGNHINCLGEQNDLWFDPAWRPRRHRHAGEESQAFADIWKDAPRVGHYAAATRNAVTVLNDLSVPFNLVSRRQIEADGLNDYKVLVLPFVESLSDREAEKITAFVNNGGTVIADYRCGIRDLHGRLRPRAALDKIFGITQTAPFTPRKEPTMNIIDGVYPCHTTSFFSQNIELEQGRANGVNQHGDPVLVRNRFGKGTGVFLNFDLYRYFDLRRRDEEHMLRELFGRLLTGVTLDRRPMLEKGIPAGHTRVFRYSDGPARYLGVLRDPSGTDRSGWEVSVPLETASHVYNIRTREYLGTISELKITLEAGIPACFACLPYKVGKVTVDGAEKVSRGETASFTVAVNAPEGSPVCNHVVFCRITDPAGDERSYFSQTLYCSNGKGELRIPIAFNDPAGHWKLEIREVVSGESETFSFEVE
ncbi:MAG: beta-galactosidase [Candidatus Pacebacteria bacterium]|nr:beta-galactosidase [Candidatus Paceibacterota bacterium]